MAPAFASVTLGELRLLLSGPTSSAGLPDGGRSRPGPGGWNRIHLIVGNLAEEVARLRSAGLKFRNDIVKGPGGQQILLEDPAGNLIELFQPAAQGGCRHIAAARSCILLQIIPRLPSKACAA